MVICPLTTARAPTSITRMPMAPTMMEANAPTLEIPVMVVATLRSRVCTPRPNTRRSPFSAR